MESSYWHNVWGQFKKRPLGIFGLFIVSLFLIVGVYAPFFASSKPIFVKFEGEWYFPLFRYLFYQGFYSKSIDLFFNVFIFIFPLLILSCIFFKGNIRNYLVFFLLALQILIMIGLILFPIKNPAVNRSSLNDDWNWQQEVNLLNPYERLNLVLSYLNKKKQHIAIEGYLQKKNIPIHKSLPTLWQFEQNHYEDNIHRIDSLLNKQTEQPDLSKKKNYLVDKKNWLEQQANNISIILWPLFRAFHWEEDAGGSQELNQMLPWWEKTRVNRKDLISALIFGIRISLVVGALSVFLSLVIGIPIGAMAGFYGGKTDIIVSRLMEIWEAMPVFFMLLMVVAITQSKSIFLIILVIGIFGWTSISRYIRGEFFKQRSLSYVEAGKAMGFHDRYLIFSDILPNAIPPVLTILPFAIMGAITSEAGLSFLGLGEESSASWGVLMDEARGVFPGESYLLWPPAILLTVLLVAIALMGDAMRDAIDPKLHRQ
ncbi:MAG: peptide ABC transporter permease [Chlamydia sp. 32-24]|nr:MAG: peptide ABC transporter permease [Chlamydia sp. 32-24]